MGEWFYGLKFRVGRSGEIAHRILHAFCCPVRLAVHDEAIAVFGVEQNIIGGVLRVGC